MLFCRAGGNLVISNRSVPTNILMPHVVYPNVSEASAWLSKAFGFSEHFRYGEPSDPDGAQMHFGKAWIMLHKARPGSASPSEIGSATQSLTLFVEDVDGHFENTKAAGARVVEQLHETVYGERQYGVEDLAGHRWLFSRHVRDLNPTEWGAVASQPVKIAPKVSLSPMLSVRGAAKAIDFYQAAFEAEVLFRLDGDKEQVVGELAIGETRFWVADESPQHQNFSPDSLGGSTVRMVIVAEDPDAVFQRALGAGAKTIWPVEDQPYGWRVGRVVDPFGHHWEIGKPLQRVR
jgi:PhnB protein